MKLSNMVYCINGKYFNVFQDRLKNQFPYTEEKVNPILWFIRDMEYDDLIITGLKTKTEALNYLYESLSED